MVLAFRPLDSSDPSGSAVTAAPQPRRQTRAEWGAEVSTRADMFIAFAREDKIQKRCRSHSPSEDVP